MPVVGTAGHVDHGKSTLIERISGRDPDRWVEEKTRGLTIDLGFAWAPLPDGTEVSFVDVPGHEKFLKNMLAGIEAIDVALFVVAADEGWMPQSEEHLAVLDLLGVGRGVVALTKIDLVDRDLQELARAEVIEKLEGTSLEGAQVIPVSASSGEGIDLLLEALAGQIPLDRDPGDRPRMWVDRSFTVSGAGTIVTGTLLDGPITIDQVVEVYPTGQTARVRSIQSHEQSHQSITPWRRVALNLGGLSHDEIQRGHMIGAPNAWDVSARFVVRLNTARFVDEIDQRGAYQLHLGSSAHRMTITGMDQDRAIFTLDSEVPVAAGDRFILRDTGRKLVIGGGFVLDPAPGRTRQAMRSSVSIEPDLGPNAVADCLLEIRGMEKLTLLSAHSAGGQPADAFIVGETALHPGLVDDLRTRAIGLVDETHRVQPLRPGLPLATLAERLRIDTAVVEAIVETADELERHGPDVSRTGHRTKLDPQQEQAWQQAREALEQSLAVPSADELGLEPDLLSLKVRTGELVRVAPGLVYRPGQIEQLKDYMAELEEFTVSQFRDAAGLSRKYAVPILEWSDKEGLTVRRGDIRRFR